MHGCKKIKLSQTKLRFIVKLQGGIGNQFFQIAFGEYMSSGKFGKISYTADSYITDTYGRKCVADSLIDGLEITSKDDLHKDVAVSLKESALNSLLCQMLNYFMQENSIDTCVLDGYWQDARYVSQASISLLRLALKKYFIKNSNNSVDSVFNAINCSRNAIAVHIRRHDYKHHGVCVEEYYTGVLLWLQSNYLDSEIFVFTDEPNYTGYFLNECNIKHKIVNSGDDLIDLQLMANCRMHVIANSSYSWWGAILSDSKGTIYPLPWSLLPGQSPSVFPKNWYSIDGVVRSDGVIPSFDSEINKIRYFFQDEAPRKLKIILVYSKGHFDPNKFEHETPYFNSSAGTIARMLYKGLCSFGEVTYCDQGESPQALPWFDVDLVVGIGPAFEKYCNYYRPKKSFFIAVNMHPARRNKLLLEHIKDYSLESNCLADWDLLDCDLWEASICSASNIILAGNTLTKRSYVEFGVPADKITTFNYDTELVPVNADNDPHRSTKERVFLYVASDIGVRKGLAVLEKLILEMNERNFDFTFHIVGKPSNYWAEEKIRNLTRSNKKVHYWGWLNTKEKIFINILRCSDFFVFPSLEEGQVGSVIEAISNGIIPIISQNCGIDFSPLGHLETHRDEQVNISIIKKALELSDSQLMNLKRESMVYYGDYHINSSGVFLEKLTELLLRFF